MSCISYRQDRKIIKDRC